MFHVALRGFMNLTGFTESNWILLVFGHDQWVTPILPSSNTVVLFNVSFFYLKRF